jgi:hypothetical protein
LPSKEEEEEEEDNELNKMPKFSHNIIFTKLL